MVVPGFKCRPFPQGRSRSFQPSFMSNAADDEQLAASDTRGRPMLEHPIGGLAIQVQFHRSLICAFALAVHVLPLPAMRRLLPLLADERGARFLNAPL